MDDDVAAGRERVPRIRLGERLEACGGEARAALSAAWYGVGLSPTKARRSDKTASVILVTLSHDAPDEKMCLEAPRTVFVVAVTELVSPVDVEAHRLAEDLGVTAYEMRISLSAGLPAIVLTTGDLELARRVLERIVARGNAAVACDDRSVIEADGMIALRRFRLDLDGVRTAESPRELLPYGDVLAILRATHRSRTDERTTHTERTFRPGRALMTGGMMMTSTQKVERTKITEERTNVCYLFRRSSDKPWLLRQDDAKYQGLGPDMQPTNALNFARTVQRLRELAPAAMFDTRLVSVKRIPERACRPRRDGDGDRGPSSTFGVDLLAHLLAMHVKQQEAVSPYRR